MSILAGIVCRSRGTSLSDDACAALRDALSRDRHDVPIVYREERAFLAKVDIGALGSPAAIVRPGRGTSMLAGEPLLPTGDPRAARTRDEDLALLHESWSHRDWSPLRRARGTFCAAHYDAASTRLVLIADKLGVRPLYYWVGPDYVLYATALRILERMMPLQLDLRGVTEVACLGFSMGDRTQYAGVQVLRAAEVVEITGPDVRRHQYWRWNDIVPSSLAEADLLRRADERFQAAVACRLRGDRTVSAFLSGGLDSRCVVAVLRGQGVAVRTFNFGPPGSQDRALGDRFAREAGTAHTNVAMRLGEPPQFTRLMAEALAASHLPGPEPERPQLVWSGDGGSLGTGYVYQTEEMVRLLRAGKPDDAITLYIRQQGAYVARRLFRPAVAESLVPMPRQGIQEELADLRCQDPGRGLHLFLMLNDQRRHLAGHFEDLDLNRLEFQLPFFDADHLAAMLEVPIDLCLYHRFYTKWLRLFPAFVTAVPWQSYPGHVPSPVPMPPGLFGQWEARRVSWVRRAVRRNVLRQARAMLAARDFPHELLRRGALRLAAIMYAAFLRDYGYVIRQAEVYYRYWTRANAGRGDHHPTTSTTSWLVREAAYHRTGPQHH